MLKCVLFDLDGTLIDSEPYSITSKLIEGKRLGYEFSEEFVIGGFGLSKENARKYYRDAYGEDVPYDELSKYRLLYVLKAMEEGTFKCKHYAIELINYLKEKGIKVGLCTSTSTFNLTSYQKYLPFLKEFDTYVTNDDVTKGKPDPQVFIIGMNNLSCLPEETLIIEDSISGLVAAYESKATPIMVPDYIKPNDYVKEHNIMVLDTLEDVKNYIENKYFIVK